MNPTVGRPSPFAAAFGALLLIVFAVGSAWGLWRLLLVALDPSASTAWMPGVILAVIAGHWLVASIRRGREQHRLSVRLVARKTAAYRKALTVSDASADIALWASDVVLRQYIEYRQARANNPAAPFPGGLLMQMRRELGHTGTNAEPLALPLSIPLSIKRPPPATPPRGVKRVTFFSP